MVSIGTWKRSSRRQSTTVDITLKAMPRRTRGQALEFVVQRPAGAQQLDRVVERGDQREIERRGGGCRAREVARDALREIAGVDGRQRRAGRRRARAQLDRDGAETAGERVGHGHPEAAGYHPR